MKKLKLVLEDCRKVGWPQIRQNTENFTRKYYSMKIESARRFNQETVVVMSKHTELRQLEFFICHLKFEHRNCLTQILRNLSKLQVLKFNNTSLCVADDRELSRIEEVELPNLNTVVLHESSAAVSSKWIRIVAQWSTFFHFLLVLSVPKLRIEDSEN